MNAVQQQLLFGSGRLDPMRKRRVAEYGRVSTQHEAQINALENQMQWYEDQRKYHPNWEVVARYVDEGVTGTLVDKRQNFVQMIKDAKAGMFDLIVTREVCRFARNTLHTLELTRKLKEYGVEVYFISDNIWTFDGDGEMRLSIMSTMAQEEARKNSERVRAGQQTSRQNGVLYGNGNIIGYDLDKEHNTYVINPEQAETIHAIYDLYEQGLGQQKIVNELCLRGYKDGAEKVSWSASKISRILRNATYMGYIGYNKSATNNYLDKKRIKNLDEDTYIYVKGDFEPIITEEQWHRCEEIRKDRVKTRKMPNGEERRMCANGAKHLWSRKLRCRCDSSYQRNKWDTLKDGTEVYGYECCRRKANPSKSFVEEHNLAEQNSCDAIGIAQWRLEMMSTLIFKQLWGEQQDAVLRACEMIETAHRQSNRPALQVKADLERKLQKEEAAKLNLSKLLAYGELTQGEYRELKAHTEASIADLKTKLAAQTEEEQPVLNLEKIRKTLQKVVDISGPKVDEVLVDRFVEMVMPVENYHYRWKLNLEKKTDAPKTTELLETQVPPVLDFVIDFAMAKAYREANQMPRQFRKSAWNDLHVQVYV